MGDFAGGVCYTNTKCASHCGRLSRVRSRVSCLFVALGCCNAREAEPIPRWRPARSSWLDSGDCVNHVSDSDIAITFQYSPLPSRWLSIPLTRSTLRWQHLPLSCSPQQSPARLTPNGCFLDDDLVAHQYPSTLMTTLLSFRPKPNRFEHCRRAARLGPTAKRAIVWPLI
jgi:hypothetical protein